MVGLRVALALSDGRGGAFEILLEFQSNDERLLTPS